MASQDFESRKPGLLSTDYILHSLWDRTAACRYMVSFLGFEACGSGFGVEGSASCLHHHLGHVVGQNA